jgi:type IV pilus assembly protein PilW
MIELLVALVISMLISLAAISALIVTRQGFDTVDASSQLRDNARFASDLIQRIAVQTGFKDSFYAMATPTPDDIARDANGLIAANITGFDNALFKITDLTSATPRSARVVGYGSDILILRYQSAKLNSDPSSNAADESMIDCAGNPVRTAPSERDDRLVSVFHVAVGADGEPALMCSRSATGLAPYSTQPVISGVESFQVLYGVDGFTSANTAFTNTADSVPDKYLRADQILVGGQADSKTTYDNWRRVRSIRIGMVLRGPLNSQQEKIAQTFYPFGLAKQSANGTPGSALSSANDVGTIFTSQADGRLRQVVTFTIHLRNAQQL